MFLCDPMTQRHVTVASSWYKVWRLCCIEDNRSILFEGEVKRKKCSAAKESVKTGTVENSEDCHQLGPEGSGICEKPVSAGGVLTNKCCSQRSSLTDRNVSVAVKNSRRGVNSYHGESLLTEKVGKRGLRVSMRGHCD